jgi:hypothetical protein
MPDAVLDTLVALADVAAAMRKLGRWWHDQLGAPLVEVSSVRRLRQNDDRSASYDVGDGLELDWYAEVDGVDGRTVTCALQVWYDGQWAVEAWIGSTSQDSFEVLVEVGSEIVAESDQLADALLVHVRRLDAAKEEALEAFLR